MTDVGIMAVLDQFVTGCTGGLMNARVRELSGEELDTSAELDKLAMSAKASEHDMERLLERFESFLRSCAFRYSSGLGENHREEMYGNGMMAFYEAVQKYDSSRGHFFPFANQIVKVRMIDYIRKARKQAGLTVSLDEEDTEYAAPQSAAITALSIRSYERERSSTQLAEEIEQFSAELSLWGITMYALTERSPKHQRLRDEYNAILSKIMHTPDVMQTIQLKRYFPVKAIAAMTGVSVKKLERARNYLLASIIIIMGDYDYLSEYVGERRYSS